MELWGTLAAVVAAQREAPWVELVVAAPVEPRARAVPAGVEGAWGTAVDLVAAVPPAEAAAVAVD